MLEIYAKGVFAGAATANTREIEAFGACHDFVKHQRKHGQREAAVKKAATPQFAGSRAETPAAPQGPQESLNIGGPEGRLTNALLCGLILQKFHLPPL